MRKTILVPVALVAALAAGAWLLLRKEPPVGADPHGHGDEHGHGRGDEQHEQGERREGVMRIPDEVLAAQGVRFERAGPAALHLAIELPGEITLNADRVAHIVPRFPGIVQRVDKDLGDRVREGDVLAVVQSNQSVAPYEVRSLVSGTIIEKHITLGEFVRDDSDIYVVADLSSVWAIISVYAKYLPQIRPGLQVDLTASGVEETAGGVIDYVGPIIGEATRTGRARVVLPNPRGAWQPGLFVTAKVAVESVTLPLAVPDEALQSVGGEPSVFVRTSEGIEARAVRTGRSDGRTVEILEGLAAGETYVAANSFLLKAELGKSEAEHQH